MKKCAHLLGCKCLVWMILASMIFGFFTPALADGGYESPQILMPSDLLSLYEGEGEQDRREAVAAPLFYMPDLYETHRLTGYGAVALTILAMVSGDDSSLHRVSGVTAAVLGVAAGASGHIAYGEGIDFREGWTRENIHAGSGYLATAALVLTAALGAAGTGHSGVGGVATAAVVVPVVVFVF